MASAARAASSALLDTHLLLWAALEPDRLPAAVAAALGQPAFRPVFSVASLWEIVIKTGRGRPDLAVDTPLLRRKLLGGGYEELDVTAPHVVGVGQLAPLHADPFDRLLLAQARSEGLPLWTVDAAVLAYGAPATDVRS